MSANSGLSFGVFFALPESSNYCVITQHRCFLPRWAVRVHPAPDTGLQLPPKIIGEVGIASRQPPRELGHPVPQMPEISLLQLSFASAQVASLSQHPTIAHAASGTSQCFPEHYPPTAPLETQDINFSLFISMSYLGIGYIPFYWLFFFCADKCSHD